MSDKNNSFGVVRRFLTEQQGATASEYAVILGAILVVLVAAVALFGVQFNNTTSAVFSGLSNGTDAAGGFGPGTLRAHTTVAIP